MLKNGLAFPVMWASQIMSAVTWLNVAILSGYGRGEVVRGLHKGVYWVYATATHNVHATVKAVCHMCYHLPLTRVQAAAVLEWWLKGHAYWWGNTCSSWYLASDIALQGITGVWDSGFACLIRIAGHE